MTTTQLTTEPTISDPAPQSEPAPEPTSVPTPDLTPNDPPSPPADLTADQAARSLELALAAARVAKDNHGEDIKVLDMRQVTPVFDYFVIATGKSRRQLHAISEDIDHRLEDDLGDKRMGIEGYNESRWIVLDYGSVVIHIFDPETREFYALEQLWSGATETALPWAEE